MVTAIVGVLKAGAAYLPLDVTNPIGRLQHIVSDLRIRGADRYIDRRAPAVGCAGADVVVADIGEVAKAAVCLRLLLRCCRSACVRDLHVGFDRSAQGVEVTHRDVGRCSTPPRVTSSSAPTTWDDVPLVRLRLLGVGAVGRVVHGGGGV